MSKRIFKEKLTTSLRRQQQIYSHFQGHSKLRKEPSLPSSAVANRRIGEHEVANSKLSHGDSILSGAFSDEKNAMIATAHVPVVFPRRREPESRLHRSTMKAIELAESKQDAMEAFLLLAESTDEKVNERMLTSLSTSLVVLQAKALLGDAQYKEVLEDARGSSTDGERWEGLTREEEKTLALYHSNRLLRYAEKGTTFDSVIGRTVEGKENSEVLRILHQVKKSVGDSIVSAPLSVLTDLVHLDVSWIVALRVYNEAKRLLPPEVSPPTEMTDRVLALMTAYKTDGIGSRPWEMALELYHTTMQSGYTSTLSTHTNALDALWRSGDSFHKKHVTLSEEHRQRVWKILQEIRSNVEKSSLRVAGDHGCAYMESLVKVASTVGRWEATLSMLAEMDLSRESTSVRLLVPTPETLLFAMSACNCAKRKTQSEGLLKIFQAHYHLGQPHSEVLLVYLQSLRHILHFPSHDVGQIVEDVVQRRNKTLSRPCIVACLQLLSSSTVIVKKTSKESLAMQLFEWYDNSVWLQEAVPRKVELETVFRCCYRIAASSFQRSSHNPLISTIRHRIRRIFGTGSVEEQWLDATEVYALQETEDWQQALAIFQRHFPSRTGNSSLPIPLFQLKQELLRALLRCCRKLSLTVDGDDTAFFLDEDERARQAEEVIAIATLAEEKALELFPQEDFHYEIMAEILLLKAAHTDNAEKRQDTLSKSLQYFSLSPQHSFTSSRVRLIADVSGLTEEHIRDAMVEGHHAMRRVTLQKSTVKEMSAIPKAK